MVGLECAPCLLTNQSHAVYILCHRAIRRFDKQPAELGIGVVGVDCFILAAEVTDSDILRVIGIFTVSRF